MASFMDKIREASSVTADRTPEHRAGGPGASDPVPGPVAGWREWVALPDLDVDWVKAKIDTGARSSALHAYDLTVVERDGVEHVSFEVHPWQRSELDARRVELPIFDRRTVRSSTGHEEDRIVVRTTIRIIGLDVDAELTLTNRDEMGFRMLVGREALRGRILVDPGRSYLGPRPMRALRRRNRAEPAA
ncbi:MAG: ATP-dependent zinc protease [Acidimicrobiia bacterium]